MCRFATASYVLHLCTGLHYRAASVGCMTSQSSLNLLLNSADVAVLGLCILSVRFLERQPIVVVGGYLRWRFLEEQQLQCAGLLCSLFTKNLGFPGDNIVGSVLIHLGNLTGFVFKRSVSEATCIRIKYNLKKNQNKIQNPKPISTIVSGEEHLENMKPYRLKYICQKPRKSACTAGPTC